MSKQLGNLIYIQPQEEYVLGSSLPIAGTELEAKNLLVLTATEEYSRTESSEVTNYPVGDGTDRSDHVREQGSTLSFSGVISPDILGGHTALGVAVSPEQYVQRVRQLMSLKRLVTIYMPDGLTASNCEITNFMSTRSSDVANGFKIRITAQRLLLADDNIIVVPFNDTVSRGVSKGNNPTTSAPEEYIPNPSNDPILPDQGLQVSVKSYTTYYARGAGLKGHLNDKENDRLKGLL